MKKHKQKEQKKKRRKIGFWFSIYFGVASVAAVASLPFIFYYQGPISDGEIVLIETDKMPISRLYHTDTPVEFLVVSPNNNISLRRGHFSWSYRKTSDTSMIDPRKFINIKSLYSSGTNTWTITITPIMMMVKDCVIRGNFDFYMIARTHKSNEISSEYWSRPNNVSVGESRIVIRDNRDAQNAIDYLTKPTVAPYDKKTSTYNSALANMKISYTDLINCLMGSNKCPFPMPFTTQNEIKDLNFVSQTLTRVTANVLIPAPVYIAPSDPCGLDYGVGLQSKHWTNDQVWVDYVYGAAWNVLAQKARWADLNFKDNVSQTHHLNYIFANSPTMTLDHWERHLGSLVSQEIVDMFPIQRGLDPFDSTNATHEATNPLERGSTVGALEPELEKMFRNLFNKRGYNFGGDFTPQTASGFTGCISLDRNPSTYLFVEGIYDINADPTKDAARNNAFAFNGWGSSRFDVHDITFAMNQPITIKLDITEKFWMPSYWFHEYDRLGEQSSTTSTPMLYPTFIDGDV